MIEEILANKNAMSGGMGGGAGGGAGGAEQTIQVNVSIFILFIDAYFDVDIYLVETGHIGDSARRVWRYGEELPSLKESMED